MSKKEKRYYTTPGGYNVYPNPRYFGGKPSDKHCSNCSWWSKLNKWCNRADDPISDAAADYCKGWEWVVPKYLYPGMEGYENANKEAGDEKGD
jgi:hypothetical protein